MHINAARMIALRTLVVLLATGSAVLAEPAPVQKFADDFGKPQLAAEWTAESGEWSVEKGMVQCRPSPSTNRVVDKLLSCKAVVLPDGFTVSADVRIDVGDGAHWAGVAFHIQDAKNYYALRIAAISSNGFYQVLKVVDGLPKAIKYAESKCRAGTFYTLTVHRKADGDYRYTIKDGTATVLDLDGVVRDRGAPFTGGRAGLYVGDSYCTLTRFHLEVATDGNE